MSMFAVQHCNPKHTDIDGQIACVATNVQTTLAKKAFSLQNLGTVVSDVINVVPFIPIVFFLTRLPPICRLSRFVHDSQSCIVSAARGIHSTFLITHIVAEILIMEYFFFLGGVHSAMEPVIISKLWYSFWVHSFCFLVSTPFPTRTITGTTFICSFGWRLSVKTSGRRFVLFFIDVIGLCYVIVRWPCSFSRSTRRRHFYKK